MRVSTYNGLGRVPETFDRLWDDTASDILLTRGWIKAYVDHFIEPGERLRVFGIEGPEEGGHQPLGLAPALYSRVYGDHVKARALRFLQPDSAVYRPVLAPGVDEAPVMNAVVSHLTVVERPMDVIRFGPLDEDSAFYRAAWSALREAGYVLQRYVMFTNRFERTEGVDAAAYLEERNSRLRNTIERRGRRLARNFKVQFEMVTGPQKLDRAIRAYEAVFAQSWKHAEALVPRGYLHAIMEHAARQGALRLGLLHLNGRPAAAQFWLLSGHVAMCYRLAFAESFREHSVGTVLTWRVLERLLDEDRVREIDFGIGDDPYKKEWMRHKRERWGILAFNPRTIRGLRGALRHKWLQPAAGLARWAWPHVRPAALGVLARIQRRR